MRRRVVRAATALAIFLTLSSCEKFGDQVESFVNDKLPQLSENFATADLKLRWQTAFTISLMDTEATLTALGQALKQVEAPTYDPTISVANGFDAMQKTSALLTDFSGYESTLDQLIAANDLAGATCTSDLIYQYAKLSDSGLESVSGIVLPDVEMSAYASNDLWDSLSRNFSAWFGSAERDAQVRKAQDAIKNYPAKAINGQRLRDLSANICHQEFATASPRLAEQKKALVAAKVSLQNAETALLASYRALEVNVMPRSYRELLDKSGSKRALIETYRPKAEANLSNKFGLITREIAGFERGFAVGADCQTVIKGVSDYGDLLAETQLQLDAIADRSRVSAAEANYQALKMLVATRKQTYPNLSRDATASACHT